MTMAGAGTLSRSLEQEAGAGPTVCPYYHEAIELIGKRWSGAIVLSLMDGPMRFSELAHSVAQISDRLLSSRLKELEAADVVSRTVIGGVPVMVEYELTDKGRALEPSLRALRHWARDWIKDPAAQHSSNQAP